MWLPAETERLHELLVEGYSASRMMAIINQEFRARFTRNAVLGKIDRMDWARERPKAVVRAPSVPRKRKRAVPHHGFNGKVVPKPPTPMPSTPVVDLHIPAGQRRSLGELDNGMCHWPVGEGAEMFFCGAEPEFDKPYCRSHCAIAYRRDVR